MTHECNNDRSCIVTTIQNNAFDRLKVGMISRSQAYTHLRPVPGLTTYTYHKEHVTLYIIAYIALNEQVMYTMSSNSSAV